jgi:hypothetical protein
MIFGFMDNKTTDDLGAGTYSYTMPPKDQEIMTKATSTTNF